MTFSIVARTANAGLFGVAIASSSPAVAARCAHARARVGAVATQNITDPALGPGILEEMQRGARGADALEAALRQTPHAAYRQVLVVGAQGPPVVHSGVHALGCVASAAGEHAVAAGNLLATGDIPRTMVETFAAASGHFGVRLLDALRAAADLGGESGPVHSAGLLIVREVSWPIVDLRVDYSATDPIGALEALWRLYAPQIDDYVRRALDPAGAPAFGVPGDP